MKLSKKQALKWIIFTSIVSSLIPLLFRLLYRNSTFPGELPYYYLGQAKNLAWPFTPYDALLSILPQNFIVLSLFNAALAVGFVLLLFTLLEKFSLRIEERFLASLLLSTSPAFLFFSAMLHEALVVLVLLLFIFYIISNAKRWYWCTPLLLVVSLFDLFTSLIAGIVVLGGAWFWSRKKAIGLAFIPLIISVVAALPLSSLPIYKERLFLVEFFSDLGGLFGFSIFVFILAIVGVANKKSKAAWIGLAVSLVLFIINPAGLLYANVYISIFAGIGFYRLLQRTWSNEAVYLLTIIIIICGILFSSVSYLDRISSLPPDEGVLKSFSSISTNKSGAVLSHESKSFWIYYMTGNPAFINPLSPEYTLQLDISSQIFESTNIDEALELLEQYNITTIWIDQFMRDGQVWENPREGLLSLLSNERFKKVYDKQGIEIVELRIEQ